MWDIWFNQLGKEKEQGEGDALSLAEIQFKFKAGWE